MTGSAPTCSQLVADGGAALVQLLTQQQVLYTAICRLATQQSDLVAKADAEALLTHLSQRQHLVDRLGQLNQKLEPYRQQWRQVYELLPAATQEKVGRLVEDAQTSLAKIISQDEADRKTLEQSRKEMSGRLHHVNKAGLAAAAYGQKGFKPAPRYTNHQG